jgi:hypothetical protein
VHVDEFCLVVVRAQDREYCMHLLHPWRVTATRAVAKTHISVN